MGVDFKVFVLSVEVEAMYKICRLTVLGSTDYGMDDEGATPVKVLRVMLGFSWRERKVVDGR